MSGFRVWLRKTCRSSRHSCHGVPGLKIQVVTKRTKIRWFGGDGLAGAGRRAPEAGTGSVVGIQFEGTGMYTGTLISDLMETVERVGQMSEQQGMADDQELQAFFTMQIPQGDQVFMGAA